MAANGMSHLLAKSSDRMAWFTALMLVTAGIGPNNSPIIDAFVAAHPQIATPIWLIDTIGFICLFLFFGMFPNGQFLPRWTRGILPVYPVIAGLGELAPGSLLDANAWPPALNWAAVFFFGLLAFAQLGETV